MLRLFYDRDHRSFNGKLTVISDGITIFKQLPCRSGQRDWYDTSWVRGKSPIPYGVHRIYLSPYQRGQRAGRKGIGEFYPIGSYDSYTIRNRMDTQKRTAIGLHEENMWDGSAGCIVVVKGEDWLMLTNYLKSRDEEYVTLEVM